jgi:hypothetical protein
MRRTKNMINKDLQEVSANAFLKNTIKYLKGNNKQRAINKTNTRNIHRESVFNVLNRNYIKTPHKRKALENV